MAELKVRDLTQAYTEFYMDKARRLGQGGFGKVYLLRSRSDGSVWAAKYQRNNNEKAKQMVREEAIRLQSVQHPEHKYVMTMYGYYEKKDHSLLVTEYLAGGELFLKISDKGFTLTETKVIIYVKQVIRALNFIHRRKIVHLDIKPQNIMLKSKDRDTIKLIDFGLAKRMSGGRCRVGFSGTIGFMAPEVLKCTYATPATDFFSLGVVVFMLLTGGYEPFWEKNDIITVQRTLKQPPNFGQVKGRVSPLATQFILGLLEKSSSARLTGEQALAHPWLAEDQVDRDTVLDTARIRSFMARQRWAKVIRSVRFTIRMQGLLDHRGSRPEFYSQEIPVTI